MNLIDETISRVEKLYENITGNDIQGESAVHAPVSAEIDPIALLNARVNEVLHMINTPVVTEMLRPQTPCMSAWESESHFLLRLDMPGVEKADIDISVQGNVVVINARRKPLSHDKGFHPRMIESTSGVYHRAIALPIEGVQPEISSNLENGVLEITIPKVATNNTKNVKKTKAQ